LLPPIPQKLRKIDDSTVGEHFSLDGFDRCYYIWEYAARKRYDFSPANQLRPVIIIVDDVLNSGEHFKVAQSFIKARYANAEVRGLFLSRCVREPVESGAPPG
jgi:hypothetical protein